MSIIIIEKTNYEWYPRKCLKQKFQIWNDEISILKYIPDFLLHITCINITHSLHICVICATHNGFYEYLYKLDWEEKVNLASKIISDSLQISNFT